MNERSEITQRFSKEKIYEAALIEISTFFNGNPLKWPKSSDACATLVEIADKALNAGEVKVQEQREYKALYEAGVAAWNPVYKIVLDERDQLRAELEALIKATPDETLPVDPNAEVVRLLTLFHEVTDLTCEEHDCTPCRRIDEVAEQALRGSKKADDRRTQVCDCDIGLCCKANRRTNQYCRIQPPSQSEPE